MTPYARVRLRKAVTLGGLGVILAALFNGVFHQMPVTAAVLGLGFGIGFVLGLVEFFWFSTALFAGCAGSTSLGGVMCPSSRRAFMRGRW